jgi:hypothetical protein
MAGEPKRRKVDEGIPGPPIGYSGDLHYGPPETPAERTSRLRREEADAAHRRSKETVILWGVVIATAVVLIVCIGVVIVPGSPPENAKWATTLLTAIVSGGLGYLLRPGGK